MATIKVLAVDILGKLGSGFCELEWSTLSRLNASEELCCKFGHHPFDFFKGQVGQPLSAILDQGLRAYPLRDMPEVPSGRTATQRHSTI